MKSKIGNKIWYLISNKPRGWDFSDAHFTLSEVKWTWAWLNKTFTHKSTSFLKDVYMLSVVGLPYFIEYNAHTSIVCTWISQWFLAKFYFYFSRIISKEIIIASLFIIKAITLSQLFSMYSARGIFQHHFQCKKVRTILDKIW